MPVTITIDLDFIYGMLDRYNKAVQYKFIGSVKLSDAYLALFNNYTEVQRLPLNCNVSAVTGGAKIECPASDLSDSVYSTNGAVFRFEVKTDTTTYTYELFRVSFPAVTKGSGDTLTVTATAMLKVG